MNLKELTTEELEELRVDVAVECERRAALAEIPEQVKALADTFATGGGDRAELLAAIEAD